VACTFSPVSLSVFVQSPMTLLVWNPKRAWCCTHCGGAQASKSLNAEIAKYSCEREAKETAGGMGNTQLLFITSAHRFIIKLFINESQSSSLLGCALITYTTPFCPQKYIAFTIRR
jgi:hypothetical protein